MHITIKRLTAAAALAAVLTVTGCAAAPGPQTAPSTVTPTNEPTNAGTPGDTVDATRAAELNAAAGTLRAYELTDGSFALVDSTAPLPENVTADFEERLAAIPVATGPADSEAVELAVDDLAYATKMQTGRNVVVVTKLWVGVPGDASVPRGTQRWIHVGDSRGEAFEPWDFLLGRGSADDYIAELKAGVVGDPQYDLVIHGR